MPHAMLRCNINRLGPLFRLWHPRSTSEFSGGPRTARLPDFNEAESRRRMSSGHSPKDHSAGDLESPFRRKLLLGTAALSATALLPRHVLAQQFPTAKVNTTGLAVTDTDVTVGILHSVTGTMAISRTGSVEAAKLAIEQIHAQGGRLGRKNKLI